MSYTSIKGFTFKESEFTKKHNDFRTQRNNKFTKNNLDGSWKKWKFNFPSLIDFYCGKSDCVQVELSGLEINKKQEFGAKFRSNGQKSL